MSLKINFEGCVHIIYRLSDTGYSKIKPDYINNENCLKNAVNTFKSSKFKIIADNISDNTKEMITSIVDVPIDCVSIGNGAGTFNLALDYALTLGDDDVVYFLENDYLHKENSDIVLLEGIDLGADYVSLYDHPDKYIDNENPYVIDGGEITKVFLTKSCHWKFTNSTTMTFATKVKTLKRDVSILRKYTRTNHPYDFQMWLELLLDNKSLITSIPGYSTHGETRYLSPLYNWENL